jgi:hypothetical protein
VLFSGIISEPTLQGFVLVYRTFIVIIYLYS